MAKINFYTTLLILNVSTLFYGCSNKPSTSEIKKIITKHHSENILTSHNTIDAPCITDGYFYIPKIFSHFLFYNNKDLSKFYSDEKRIIDELSVFNILRINLVYSKTSTHPSLGLVKIEQYDILLTKEAEKLKVGETSKDYVLKIFEPTAVLIKKQEFSGKDKLKIKYSLGSTILSKALVNICEAEYESDAYKRDINMTLYFKEKEWKIFRAEDIW